MGESEDNPTPFGDRLPSVQVPPPGPASDVWAQRLTAVESRNVTYLGSDFPVFWVRARGANVEDADGNVFVDLTGAFGVAAAGHRHPRIVEALKGQADILIHGMGDVHPPTAKVRFLERLAGLLPWNDARGVMASSGSEAVEIALKTAQMATGRSGIIAFEGSYHGLTLGALSVTGRDDFRAPFRDRIPRDVSFVPFPDGGPSGPGKPGESGRPSGPEEQNEVSSSSGDARSDEVGRARDAAGRAVWPQRAAASLDALDEALARPGVDGNPPGCVIVEPIQGRGGIRIPPSGFLREVADRAHRAGAIVIFDEIFTGFGRTGTTFAFEQEEVVPDLLCVGKPLGGGLPLSCCIGPRAIMDSWPTSTGEALHTSTFLGHPLACETGLAFLDVLEDERLADRAVREGHHFRAHLSAVLQPLPGVHEVRGRGLFLGVECRVDEKESDEAPLFPGFGVTIATRGLAEGLFLLPAGDRGEVVEMTPPLTIARQQLDWAAEALGRLVRSAGLKRG